MIESSITRIPSRATELTGQILRQRPGWSYTEHLREGRIQSAERAVPTPVGLQREPSFSLTERTPGAMKGDSYVPESAGSASTHVTAESRTVQEARQGPGQVVQAGGSRGHSSLGRSLGRKARGAPEKSENAADGQRHQHSRRSRRAIRAYDVVTRGRLLVCA